VVELACDFGLVRSLDLIGQMVSRKGTAMQGNQALACRQIQALAYVSGIAAMLFARFSHFDP
jgi:hypothetical protein